MLTPMLSRPSRPSSFGAGAIPFSALLFFAPDRSEIPLRITKTELESLNTRFRAASPAALLRFARDTFGERAAILSSMQRAGTALCFLADRESLSFDVLFVDTGVLHQETLAT